MKSETSQNPSPIIVPPSSGGSKTSKGCGIGCLVIVLFLIIGSIAGYFYFMHLIDGYEETFINNGYTPKSGHILSITDPIEHPTYYKAQLVQIKKGAQAEVGLLCQMAEIEGVYTEKVTFRGQILRIRKTAQLLQGLDTTCQIIENLGTIEGGITGYHQLLSTEPVQGLNKAFKQVEKSGQ